jgi:murein DD-endopeptidase MepM/ murein hydrolase activator NlpD
VSRYDGDMRFLVVLVLVLLVVAGAVFWVSGRAAGPVITITQPAKAVGAEGAFDIQVEAPGGKVGRLDIELQQGSSRVALFSLASPGQAVVKQETADRIRVTGPLGKRVIPSLQAGTARLAVTAARPVLFGLRTRETTASREVTVVLTPPRVSVVSTHHFINHGGAEFVVYRAAPPEVVSGVRVGDQFYPGFPASAAGVAGADPSLKVAFFALLWNQDLNTPIELFAKDEAGNESVASFDHRVFPKPFLKSRIELSDTFLQKVVTEILGKTPDLNAAAAGEDLLASFLRINRELRQKNADQILSIASQTAPSMLWKGPFLQLGNSKVESKFADHRTYFYQGKEVDQQVHLGYDLAVTANVPVLAENAGIVLFADYLGIYGNCVIIDHGLGVQSLYGHLSSFDVKAGDRVEKGSQIGRSGMTGLAGGDHLHFAVLIGGRPVSPVEWWDAHWVEDRVTRKIQEAAGGPM